MNFAIVYVTVAKGEQTERYAQRFTTSFRTYQPGGHNWGLLVVSNGGEPSGTTAFHFTHLRPTWYARSNDGWDIGAYIDVANRLRHYDAVLCLGQSVYFHRAGWLKRIEEVWAKHGPGLYGFYASKIVRPHLNTTAFCTTPELLRGWGQVVDSKEKRYAFEHGPMPFWKQVEGLKKPVRLVMWNHDQAPWEWRALKTENEFWRGDQSQCLMWCSHTDRWANAVKATRTKWTNNTDRGLQQ